MRVVLGLGSNLGDRLAHLRAALAGIARELSLVAVSPVYETLPVGGPPQPDYLNAVIVAEAPPGTDLLGLVARLEAAAGRRRRARWGERTLDVDVLACDGVSSDDPLLTLPHPRAHERAFVLAPWADVEPEARLPGRGRVADLAARAGRAGVRRRDDLPLLPP